MSHERVVRDSCVMYDLLFHWPLDYLEDRIRALALEEAEQRKRLRFCGSVNVNPKQRPG